MTEPAKVIGVLGAGTMGAGIAQMACANVGARTLLHDPVPAALERGIEGIRTRLAREVDKGRLAQADADAAVARLEPAPALEDLASAELVIEAAPESLELKKDIYERLSSIVSPTCVLATNTSSIPVTAIAASASHPERVVGLHFFNPAPVMRLVELIAGEESSDEALALARATGEAMGKRVILAADVTGFLVNRCNRPFGLEAMRLVTERIAPLDVVDRICRQGGGFRMGPFELMDLVGIDVGFDVARSFFEQSFGEPRWRPSPLAARMVASGRHGRKKGRGWYDYSAGSHRPDDPEPPAGGGGDGRLVVIAGYAVIADELRTAAMDAGFEVADVVDQDSAPPWLILDCGHDPEEDPPLQGGPEALLVAGGPLAEIDPGGDAAGFHALAPLSGAQLIECTRHGGTTEVAAERLEEFINALGKHAVWVGDAPGLVLGRIVAQLVNEAAFALGEGVGSAEDIDAGMLLGVNHPHGPLIWGDAIGLDHVLLILDALNDEYREERYRAAPLLRRLVAEGRLGAHAGGGFHAA
jgi:3-hydroxybutyryl-CoA dehydrogenase